MNREELIQKAKQDFKELRDIVEQNTYEELKRKLIVVFDEDVLIDVTYGSIRASIYDRTEDDSYPQLDECVDIRNKDNDCFELRNYDIVHDIEIG